MPTLQPFPSRSRLRLPTAAPDGAFGHSETDIFLRELISNASDACDRLRYEAIAAPDLIADGAPPKIRIVPDKKADTLSVIDSGIGMDRQS